MDDPKHRKDTAKFVNDLIKSGRIVERVSDEEFTKNVKLCRCKHRVAGTNPAPKIEKVRQEKSFYEGSDKPKVRFSGKSKKWIW